MKIGGSTKHKELAYKVPAQYTYLYSRLTPAKTIVTCVRKKTSLEFMELLVSADATTISKINSFFFQLFARS